MSDEQPKSTDNMADPPIGQGVAIGLNAPIADDVRVISPSGYGTAPLRWHAILAFNEMTTNTNGTSEATKTIVNLPWPMAKSLFVSLKALLMTYEAMEGKVEVPRSFYLPNPFEGEGPKEGE